VDGPHLLGHDPETRKRKYVGKSISGALRTALRG
jgi:hypothetical protein